MYISSIAFVRLNYEDTHTSRTIQDTFELFVTIWDISNFPHLFRTFLLTIWDILDFNFAHYSGHFFIIIVYILY